MPTSAIAKLNKAKTPHIVSPVPPGFPGAMQAASMVVSTPREVDALIREIPPGHVTTLSTLRQVLARRHGADMACPVSTAIFINIAAAAAEEYAAMGEAAITPYWRVLRADGALNEMYPGGTAAQQARLEAEGIPVERRRKGLVVADYAAWEYTFDAPSEA